MKINKVKDGVELICFGSNQQELLRDLHDSVVLASEFSDTLFAQKRKRERRKKADPKIVDLGGHSIPSEI